MPDEPQIRGRLLARNTSLNLLGQAIPLLVGLGTIPYVVRGLGTVQFGVLSIAWVLLGYFSLFDLGLGRATTKFVAECLGRMEIEKLPRLVWTSLGIQILFGLAGALIAAAATPLLVEKVLKIPPDLVHDTRVCLFLLAASLPVVLVANGLRGVLEAAQRFDLVNYVKVPINVSIFLLPAVAIPFGAGLPGIVLLLVLVRLGAILGYLILCLKVFPILGQRCSLNFELFRPLLSYGGWITVSNLVSPIFTYVDRFFIGALLSMAAVSYYTAPYEAITRAGMILPGSLIATLFPAFSSLDAGAAKERIGDFYVRSVKLLLLLLGPPMLLVVVFGRAFLLFWLGADFADKSSLTLQILAMGVLVNALAVVPFGLLQGVGRPDVTAKFHLVELPVYAGMVWILIGRMGISGAALAWTLRVTLDALLLFGACRWFNLVSLRALSEKGLLRSVLVVAGFGLASFLTLLSHVTLTTQAVLVAGMLPFVGLGIWNFALDSSDRSLLVSATSHLVTKVGGAK